MTTFRIHEDLENIPHNGAMRAKKIVGKKGNFLENRGILHPVDNGAKQEAKRVKLAPTKCEDKYQNVRDVKVKEEVTKEIQQEFLKVEREREEETVKEVEKSDFPIKLLHEIEYMQDIKTHLYQLESVYPTPKSNFMQKQLDLSWKTRSILIDWLVSVAEEYNMCDQTLHLSVNFIDRFLSQIAVVRGKFQLLGATAMMLAGKIEEIYPPEPKEWSYLTGDAFSVRQILKMEQLVLKVLKFKVQPPTIYTFIQLLSAELNLEPKIAHLALYLSELSILEGDGYINILPSKVAAASVALARYILTEQNLWPKKLKEASGYSIKQLSPVVEKQQKTFRDSPMKEQQAIQSKYKSDKYHRVGLLKPRILDLNQLEDE